MVKYRNERANDVKNRSCTQLVFFTTTRVLRRLSSARLVVWASWKCLCNYFHQWKMAIKKRKKCTQTQNEEWRAQIELSYAAATVSLNLWMASGHNVMFWCLLIVIFSEIFWGFLGLKPPATAEQQVKELSRKQHLILSNHISLFPV